MQLGNDSHTDSTKRSHVAMPATLASRACFGCCSEAVKHMLAHERAAEQCLRAGSMPAGAAPQVARLAWAEGATRLPSLRSLPYFSL